MPIKTLNEKIFLIPLYIVFRQNAYFTQEKGRGYFPSLVPDLSNVTMNTNSIKEQNTTVQYCTVQTTVLKLLITTLIKKIIPMRILIVVGLFRGISRFYHVFVISRYLYTFGLLDCVC